MLNSNQVFDVFLQPGEYFFGGREVRIRTLLGSCVSLVFWHPQLLLGGMCHYMLPGRARGATHALDGRYADEAVELMLGEIRTSGTQLRDYQVRMFGGGDMFPGISRAERGHVGMKNVVAARELMCRHGFGCVSEHVEGLGHRNLIFQVGSGQVALKHLPLGQGDVAATMLFPPQFAHADPRGATSAKPATLVRPWAMAG